MRIIRPVTIDDDVLVSSDVTENDYAAYNGASTYADGDHVISTSTHRIYESLQSSNTGNALPVSPETSTSWWQDIGPTNRWRMFDGGINTQTEQATGITILLDPGRIDSVGLLNLQGSTYRVRLFDAPGSPAATVYDSGTVSVDESPIGDWYEYFFEEIIPIADVVLMDLPIYPEGVLQIEISAPGASAKVGMVVVGLLRDLGDFQWRPRVGIIDYSVKATDEFGNTTITERAFSKRVSGEVFVDNALVDTVIRIMTQYRAAPALWVGAAEYRSTIVYGFYKSFDATIDSPAGTFYSLELEGLT